MSKAPKPSGPSLELDLMQDEPSLEDLHSPGPIVLSSALLLDVKIAKEGGYLITLDVSELDRGGVARLIQAGKTVFNVVLVPNE